MMKFTIPPEIFLSCGMLLFSGKFMMEMHFSSGINFCYYGMLLFWAREVYDGMHFFSGIFLLS